jgi:small conductance mechanosensitive channel
MLKQDFEYSILIIATLFGAFVVSETLRWLIKRTANIKAKKLKIDPTSYSFFKNATSFVVYTTAIIFIIYSVPRFKAFGTTLFAGAGIFAAIIALASQQAFSNIISGIFIVISKPFRVGDYIELNPLHKGNIEDITLRHTIIRDVQNNRIIVPNSKINSETIVNFHLNEEMKKEKIEYCIDIDSDIDKAISIIKEEVSNHPDFLRQLELFPEKSDLKVRVVRIENGSIRLRVMVDSEDSDKAYYMHCDLNYSIKKRFDQEGISFEKRMSL